MAASNILLESLGGASIGSIMGASNAQMMTKNKNGKPTKEEYTKNILGGAILGGVTVPLGLAIARDVSSGVTTTTTRRARGFNPGSGKNW